MANENDPSVPSVPSLLTEEAKRGVEGLLARPDIKMALAQIKMDELQPPTANRHTAEQLSRSQDEPGAKKESVITRP